MILIKRIVQTFRSLRCRGVVREPAEYHRKCRLDRAIYRRRFRVDILTDLFDRLRSLLLPEQVL